MHITFFYFTIAVFFAFLSVWVFDSYSPYAYESQKQLIEFYEQDFGNETKIFLIGSSVIGSLNSIYINNNIEENVDVYNLAKGADLPSRRINQVDELISTKPDLIIYGIGLRDLISNEKTQQQKSFLPEPKLLLNGLLSNNFGNIENQFKVSKFILFKNIYYVLNPNVPLVENEGRYSPFYNNTYHSNIHTFDEIEKSAGTVITTFVASPDSNYEYQIMKKILQKFKDNDIPVVIFTPPYHPILWNSIDDNSKQNFDRILSDIEKDFGYPIYRLETKFFEQNIWFDLQHVSSSKMVTIYDDELIKIIKMEVK